MEWRAWERNNTFIRSIHEKWNYHSIQKHLSNNTKYWRLFFNVYIYIYSFYVWKTVQLRNPHAKFLLQQSWKDTLFILILPIAIFILITTTLFHLLESPRTWRKKEGKRNYYNSSMEYSKYSPFPRCSPDLSLTLLKRELRNSPVEDIKYSLFLRKQHRVVASFRKNDHPQGHPPLIIIFSRAQYGGRGVREYRVELEYVFFSTINSVSSHCFENNYIRFNLNRWI